MSLSGRTILLTRPPGQNRSLREPLEARGARVVEIPAIEIVPPESWDAVDRAVARLSRYDWVIFTSANAVDAFCDRAGGGLSNRIAVVGSQTARRAAARGLTVDLVPEDFRAEGLLRAFGRDLAGVRILIPRAAVAGEDLPRTLEARGARVDVVTVYRTVRPESGGQELDALLAAGALDCVVFTSGSTVRNFLEMLAAPERLHGVAVAVIGPVTRQTALDAGLDVHVEAAAATAADLVEAIDRHFA